MPEDWGCRKCWMPTRSESEPTEYAGRIREFSDRTKMILDDEYEIVITGYDKELGLYIVFRYDCDSPIFRVSPSRLKRKEGR